MSIMRIVTLLFIGLNAWSITSHAHVITNLKTDGLLNPIAINGERPALSWQINATERGIVQTAYHILVASSEERLNQNIGDLWDSGKQLSNNSTRVQYLGSTLKSRDMAFWKVKVYTNKGETAWSQIALWRMGLLHYKEWSGRWIGFDRYFPQDDESLGKLAARYFRKEFVARKEIKSAFAYIMGLGLYEFYLNGKKVGDAVLAPSPTDYSKNIKYNAFDVTALLKTDQNTIGVILGNGRFYAMRQAKPYKVKTFGFPKLQFLLLLTYSDGTEETIKTDDSWRGTVNGPIVANNEYDGEEYDARKELAGWAKSGFNDQSWLKANYVQEPGGNYESQHNNNMKVMQNIQPQSIEKRADGKYIVDFGQNFSGWVKLKVKGSAGTQIKLRFAESLQDNGDIFTTNLRDAKATDSYILKGADMEEWEPRFTYHGFRYVEVSGFPEKLTKSNFIGRFVYDDIETIGKFSSSHPLLNQICQNAWWGIASNYKGMPVDCPQRNERQPWLGDRPISAYGESFLFQNEIFYTKWLQDIQLAQKEDGAIPDVAPAFWKYYSDNMTWPGTYLLIAKMLYQQTGDIELLKKHYIPMKKWMYYMQSRYMNAEGIITKDSYGDWCFPPATIEEGRGKIADKKYPSTLIASAYYYYLLTIMADFSIITENRLDYENFKNSAQEIKKSFNKKFYNDAGFYGRNSLTDNILPLYFGIVDPANKDLLANRIVTIVEKENNSHLSTGLIGTQWILRTLTTIGRADLAYKIATNRTYPSWGYMVDQGATTIWELWNGNTAHPKMNSQNHVMMLGDLLIWCFEDLAGIKALDPGFQKIQMNPQAIEGLHHIEATYQSSYGEITSSWHKTDTTFVWNVTVPPNVTAQLYIPSNGKKNVMEGGENIWNRLDIHMLGEENDRVLVEIGSGDYYFKSQL